MLRNVEYPDFLYALQDLIKNTPVSNAEYDILQKTLNIVRNYVNQQPNSTSSVEVSKENLRFIMCKIGSIDAFSFVKFLEFVNHGCENVTCRRCCCLRLPAWPSSCNLIN
jgi:hypothetical protein